MNLNQILVIQDHMYRNKNGYLAPWRRLLLRPRTTVLENIYVEVSDQRTDTSFVKQYEAQLSGMSSNDSTYSRHSFSETKKCV